ncbi:MAG: SGNH/GDSL hydrolase family protein [Pseudomonadota bacterium]|nr:SGNH/GDSL hydrolase family protein [Pseudomonadota bacterium]
MNWTKKLYDIALVFSSVLMALLFAEFIVGSFFPQNLNGTWVIEHNSGLALNKTTGTSRAQFGERVVSYHFGEYHNRKTEKQDSLQKGMPKLLVLGDSFTLGVYLSDGKTYADKLQEHFQNEYEIINAAVGGWGASDYTKYVEIFCDKIKPEQILIYLSFGDIDRTLISSLYTVNDEGQIETRFVNKKNKLKILLNSYPFYQFLLEHSHLLQVARRAYLRLFNVGARVKNNVGTRVKNRSSEDFTKSLMLGKKLFLKMKNDAKQCGAELKVFNIAWEGVVLNPVLDDHTMHFLRETNEEEFFSENGITFFDLTNTKAMEEVIDNKIKFIIPKDEHPNELGAERIFLATLESLNSQ